MIDKDVIISNSLRLKRDGYDSFKAFRMEIGYPGLGCDTIWLEYFRLIGFISTWYGFNTGGGTHWDSWNVIDNEEQLMLFI